MNRRSTKGFSLLELMVTLAVAGVLAAIAVPNFQSFFQNNRLTAASNDLLRSIQVSRSEAIKRQTNVVVCASDAPDAADPDCSNGDFEGWVVFEDQDSDWEHDSTEEIIERHPLLHDSLTVLTDNGGFVSFSRSGFANPSDGTNVPTRTIVIHDERGVQQTGSSATARAVLIEVTGRASVTKAYADVCDALSEFSESCS